MLLKQQLLKWSADEEQTIQRLKKNVPDDSGSL